MADTRTWTLKIRGDSGDAVRAVNKVERRFRKLDLNKGFGSKLRRLSTRFRAFGSKMAATGKRIARTMAIGAAAGVAALGVALVSTIKAGREGQKVADQSAQVIKTIGASSWTSAKQVEAFSDRLARQTGVSDDVIQNGANLILTFKEIRNQAGKGNKIFDRTVTLANDMSVALGQDMKSSSIQLGKALNDPIKGVTALQRVGVSFSEAQKEQITSLVESNDLLGAQKLILGEVENQFSGTAKAVATPWDRLKIVLAQTQETVGRAIIPVFERIAAVLVGVLPAAIEKVKAIWRGFIGAFQEGDITSDGIVGVAERVGLTVRIALPHIKRIAGVIKDWAMRIKEFFADNPKVLFAALGAVIGTLVLGAVAALAAALISVISPFLLVVAAIGAVAGAVTYAYTRWSWFRDAVDAVVSWFKDTAWPALQSFADLVQDKFGELTAYIREIWPHVQETITRVLNVVRAYVSTWVAIISGLWDRFGSTIMASVRSTWSFIQQVIEAAMKVIRGVIQTVTALINGDWGRAWEGILMILSGAWAGIKAMIGQAINQVRTIIALAWQAILAATGFIWRAILGAIRGTWRGIKNATGAAIGWVRDRTLGVLRALRNKWNDIWEGMGRAVSRIWGGIEDAVRGGVNRVIDVINWFIRLINKIPGVDLNQIGHVGGGGGGQSRGSTFRARERATGGMITNGPQYLVGEGNPAYPEAVIATDPRYRRRNQALLAWAAGKLGMDGTPGFQIGGIPGVSHVVSGVSGALDRARDFVGELSSRALGPVRDAAKSMINQIPGGDRVQMVRDMGKGIVDQLYEWASGKTEEAASSAPGAGAGVQRWRSVALRALSLAGAPASWIGSLLRRMQQESGGNPRAINNWDINAQRGDPSRGLMQTIGSTFSAYAGRFASRGIYDPLANIYAAIKYTIARYGSGPAGWNQPGGYERGGILGFRHGGTLGEDVMGVGPSGRRYMMHRGERVTSKRDSDKPRTVVQIDRLVVQASSPEEGRAAGKAFLDVLEKRKIMTDARIA